MSESFQSCLEAAEEALESAFAGLETADWHLLGIAGKLAEIVDWAFQKD